jgi:hypothetical protein
MSDLRVARIAEFDTDARWAGPRAEYADRLADLRTRYGVARGGTNDDPRYIHSEAYDERQKSELALYDEYQNDMIGPGGWTNINVEHYRNVDLTIRRHRGARILVTFGGGHKYWLLERLREREDVTLIDLAAYLPER